MRITTPQQRSLQELAEPMVCCPRLTFIFQLTQPNIAQVTASKASHPSKSMSQTVEPVGEAVSADKGRFFFFFLVIYDNTSLIF
jgi:hypothetical protein